MNRSKSRFLGAIAGLSMLTVVGCANQTTDQASTTPGSETPAAAAGEVNVYSSRHYDTDDALYEEFTKQTGIQVNLIEGKDDELIERIKNEGANSPADILLTVDAGRLWRAEEEGLLQPVESDVLTSTIPESLRDPEGLWFGLAKRARVIVYNTETVDPSELSTYEALAEPAWQGRVCIRSSTNIYNQSLLGSIIESDGEQAAEEWAQGIVANLAREPEGGDTDQILAVAAGQCDVAIVNHYYWARMASSDDAAEQDAAAKTAVFFPNQEDRGTHVNISGAGVIATAPNEENAIAFLEYLTTPEAQRIFSEGSMEFPVAEGAEEAPAIAELGDFKEDSINVATYGENNPKAVEISDRAGWK